MQYLGVSPFITEDRGQKTEDRKKESISVSPLSFFICHLTSVFCSLKPDFCTLSSVICPLKPVLWNHSPNNPLTFNKLLSFPAPSRISLIERRHSRMIVVLGREEPSCASMVFKSAISSERPSKSRPRLPAWLLSSPAACSTP